jgi:ABC-type polar amino acid transport system ATPase subunit
MTMIVVTHEMGFAREAARRGLCMDEGRVLEDGAPKQLFEKPANERMRTFLEKVL